MRHDPDRVESVNRLGRNCQLMIPSLPIRERGIWPAFDLGLEHFSQQCLADVTVQVSCIFVPKHVMVIDAPSLSHAERTLYSWEKPSLQHMEMSSPPPAASALLAEKGSRN